MKKKSIEREKTRKKRSLVPQLSNFQKIFKAAMDAYRYVDALKLVETELRHRGEYGKLREIKAWLNATLMEYETAEKEYSILISRGCTDPNIYLSRAYVRVQFNVDDFKGALADCKTFFTLSGKTEKYHLIRAEAFQGLKKYGEALVEYNEALKSNKNLAKAHFGLARVYSAIDRNDEAVDEYTAGMSIQGKDNIMLKLRGMSSFQCGQIQNAINDIAEYLRGQPKTQEIFEAVIDNLEPNDIRSKKRKISMVIQIFQDDCKRMPVNWDVSNIKSTQMIMGLMNVSVPRVKLLGKPQVIKQMPKHIAIKRAVTYILNDLRSKDSSASLEEAKRAYAGQTQESYDNVNRLYHYKQKEYG